MVYVFTELGGRERDNQPARFTVSFLLYQQTNVYIMNSVGLLIIYRETKSSPPSVVQW